MNRRETLKAAGASVLGGTALISSAAATDRGEGGPTVVSAELERSDVYETDEYTVDYKDDGRVEITGHVIASEPCREISVDSITETEYGDVVDLELIRPKTAQVCAAVVAEFEYTVELEYEAEANDVFVQIPDGING